MANIRGQGGAAQRNLVGNLKFIPNLDKQGNPVMTKLEDGTEKQTGKYLCDFQLDLRDERAKGETNAHLNSHRFTVPGKTGADGKPETRVAHGEFYSESQVKAILEAGDSIQNKDGTITVAFKADLMAKDGNVVVRTDKPINKSDFKLGTRTMANQAKTMKANKEAVAAERAAAKNAPEAEAAVAEPEADLEAGIGE